MKEIYTFASADDRKTPIHAVKWTPDAGEPVAVMQLVHGMIEYIERYEEFAEYLAGKGFVVMGHDHIGHGDSVESPADWGIFHTKTPAATLVEDMYTNYCLIREQYPGLPHFILGHSMGSYLLRMFLCEKADGIKDCAGAIVMGTGSVPDGTSKMGLTLIRLIEKFKGPDHKSGLMPKLSFGGKAYKGYNMDGSDPANSWLSKNLDSVTKYYHDPKDTFAFSLNGYRILMESTSYDNQPENLAKMNKALPVLIVSGAEDPVGDRSAGVKKVYEEFLQAGMRDVTCKLYEGDRHEILQETDRQQVFADIYDWAKARL